jgi:choline transport protein
MIQGICLVNYPDYDFTKKPYQGTLIAWAVVLVCVFFNAVIGSLLPKVEAAFLIAHVLGFFAILIPLVYYGPHADATELFSSYLNEGGWSTYGLSFMVGSLGSAFSFLGADAAVHVCSTFLHTPSY